MEKGEKKKEKGSWEKQLFEVRCEEKARKKKSSQAVSTSFERWRDDMWNT